MPAECEIRAGDEALELVGSVLDDRKQAFQVPRPELSFAVVAQVRSASALSLPPLKHITIGSVMVTSLANGPRVPMSEP